MHRGTSLIRNSPPPRTTTGPYCRVLEGVGLFLMSEVPLHRRSLPTWLESTVPKNRGTSLIRNTPHRRTLQQPYA